MKRIKEKHDYPEEQKERYLDLFTDFGFKKVFKSEENRDILIDLLRTLLKNPDTTPLPHAELGSPYNGLYHEDIADITLMDPEILGVHTQDRNSILDLHCVNKDGSTFVIEVQNNPQTYFMDRILYYLGKLLVLQGEKGDWDFHLNKTYIITLMDFSSPHTKDLPYRSDVMLMDVLNHTAWSDKVGLLFLNLHKFKKQPEELENRYEKWLYYIKNLHTIKSTPERESDKSFRKLLQAAELSNLTKGEQRMYKTSKERRWEEEAIRATILEMGHKKGLIEGISKGKTEGRNAEKVESAKRMILKGIDYKIISEITELSIQDIEKL